MLVSNPAADAVWSRWPPPRASMPGSTARAPWTWAITLTSQVRCQSASDISTPPPMAIPAFMHSRSIGPSVSSTCATTAWVAAPSVTSSGYPVAPVAAATSATRSMSMSTAATRMPSEAKRSTRARPIPLAPPVTIATRPLSVSTSSPSRPAATLPTRRPV